VAPRRASLVDSRICVRNLPRIWLVTEPGTSNFGETWRATFLIGQTISHSRVVQKLGVGTRRNLYRIQLQ